MPKKNFSFRGYLWSFDIFSAIMLPCLSVRMIMREGGGECGSCLCGSALHLHINAHGTPLTLLSQTASSLSYIAPQGRTHDSEIGSLDLYIEIFMITFMKVQGNTGPEQTLTAEFRGTAENFNPCFRLCTELWVVVQCAFGL